MLEVSTIGDSPVTVSVSSSVADLQVDVDRGREVRRQLDAFTHDGGETRQLELDGVGAGTQREDRIRARTAGHGRTRFFDQRRTRHFDGHAGQHAARCISDRAGDRAGLRRGHDRREDESEQNKTTYRERTHHNSPPWLLP